MTKPATVLIASNSLDASVQKVADLLGSLHQKEAIIYESDKVSSGDISFVAHLKDGRCLLTYGDVRIDVASIKAAWLRRPNVFRYKREATDTALKLTLDEETKGTQDSVLEFIPDQVWLNPRTAVRRLQPKLYQLHLAQELGFNTPKTVIGNDWKHIRAQLKGAKEIVFKMPRGFLYRENQPYSIHTKVFANDHTALPVEATPYPGIWQEYIPKKREWRVTVVGRKVFCASIYSTEKSRDDWRKHQFGPDITFRFEELPEDIKNKCLAFLARNNLRYGAFDFIEDPSGRIYFLEVNTSGQFKWLEDTLNLPIAEAIAAELAAIAE